MLNIRVEADKDKVAVDVDPGWADEPEFLTVEGGTIRIITWHANELPLVIKRPGVIEALKGFGITTALTAYLRTAMRAGVEQDTYHAIAATYQDDGPAGHTPGFKIPWLWDLGGVPSIEPALLETAPVFERHDLTIGECTAMHARQ